MGVAKGNAPSHLRGFCSVGSTPRHGGLNQRTRLLDVKWGKFCSALERFGATERENWKAADRMLTRGR